MSVTVIANLPETGATTGVSTLYEPLGGDGMTAPLSATFIQTTVTGDASGGNAILTVNIDPRWAQILDYATLKVENLALDQSVSWQVHNGNTAQLANETQNLIAPVSAQFQAPITIWYPPLMTLVQSNPDSVPSMSAFVNNNVSDVYTCQWKLLNFDREAPHDVPSGIFAANLSPRS